MRNKKTKFIKAGFILALVGLSAPMIKADVVSTTVPYTDDNGVKSVNIEELARNLKGEVVENESSVDVLINDTILSIYPEKNCIFFDGKLIPLKTKAIKDYITGEEFQFPTYEKITEKDGGHLIPVSLVSKYFQVQGEEKGYVIKTEKNDENSYENETDSNINKNTNNEGTINTNKNNSSNNNNGEAETSSVSTGTANNNNNDNTGNGDGNSSTENNNENDSVIEDDSNNKVEQ